MAASDPMAAYYAGEPLGVCEAISQNPCASMGKWIHEWLEIKNHGM